VEIVFFPFFINFHQKESFEDFREAILLSSADNLFEHKLSEMSTAITFAEKEKKKIKEKVKDI
jgi:hypothetical protein